jgi:hypothetical protein
MYVNQSPRIDKNSILPNYSSRCWRLDVFNSLSPTLGNDIICSLGSSFRHHHALPYANRAATLNHQFRYSAVNWDPSRSLTIATGSFLMTARISFDEVSVMSSVEG